MYNKLKWKILIIEYIYILFYILCIYIYTSLTNKKFINKKLNLSNKAKGNYRDKLKSNLILF